MHNTARRRRRFRLAPKLIPPPLDIIHPVDNDDRVAAQRAAHAPIHNCTGFFLGARIVVDAAGIGAGVRGDYRDFVGWR